MKCMESCPWKEISLDTLTLKGQKWWASRREKIDQDHLLSKARRCGWRLALAYTVLIVSLGTFGSLGTSHPPKSSFGAANGKDRRIHRRLGVGMTQPGLCTGTQPATKHDSALTPGAVLSVRHRRAYSSPACWSHLTQRE